MQWLYSQRMEGKNINFYCKSALHVNADSLSCSDEVDDTLQAAATIILTGIPLQILQAMQLHLADPILKYILSPPISRKKS